MAERNHSHIDLLKVDIESSEWSLFDELCKGGPEAQPLPFDQLMIELHRVDAALMHKLVKCLDAHGLYPFAREENLHGMACTDHPSNAGTKPVVYWMHSASTSSSRSAFAISIIFLKKHSFLFLFLFSFRSKTAQCECVILTS